MFMIYLKVRPNVIKKLLRYDRFNMKLKLWKFRLEVIKNLF